MAPTLTDLALNPLHAQEPRLRYQSGPAALQLFLRARYLGLLDAAPLELTATPQAPATVGLGACWLYGAGTALLNWSTCLAPRDAAAHTSVVVRLYACCRASGGAAPRALQVKTGRGFKVMMAPHNNKVVRGLPNRTI